MPKLDSRNATTSIEDADLLWIAKSDGAGGFTETAKMTGASFKSTYVESPYWKANISSDGASVPTVSVLKNSLALTIIPDRVALGDYSFAGFGTTLSGLFSVEIHQNNSNDEIALLWGVVTADKLSIKSYVNLILTDGLDIIITVTKFD